MTGIHYTAVERTPAKIGGQSRRNRFRLGPPSARLGRDKVEFSAESNTSVADDTVNYLRSTTQMTKKMTAAGTSTTIRMTAGMFPVTDITVDVDKSGTWKAGFDVGDIVQNHDDGGGANGDNWTGVLLSITATNLRVWRTDGFYSAVDIADGVYNVTRSDEIAGANMTAKANAGVDVSSMLFRVSVFVHAGSGVSDPDQIGLFNVKLGSTAWSAFLDCSLGEVNKFLTAGGGDGGWIEFWGSTDLGTDTGGVDLTKITHIRYSFTTTAANATPSLSIGELEFYPSRVARFREVVKITVNADKSATWRPGNLVQNHNDGGGANGDNWSGGLGAITATLMTVELNLGSVIGNVDLADGVQNVTLTDTLPGANQTAVDAVGVNRVEPKRPPQLAITWDDGKANQFDELAYLAAMGVYCTVYVIPSYVGNTNYMTLAQLREVQKMGHLVANHGWAHAFWVSSSLSDADCIADITKGIDWMCNNGFAEGARHWSQPGGTGNLRTLADLELLMRYFDTVRLTGGIYTVSDPGGGPVFLVPHTFDRIEVSGPSASVIIAALKDSDGVVILGFHDGGIGSDMTDLWDDIALDVVDGEYVTATIDQLL